jgi:pimeloyl-[acyl-carrier protein] methyl ester esterase
MPSVEVLEGGLEILRQDDLRAELDDLPLPFLRIYGYLDGLVPRRIAEELEARWPDSSSVVMEKAAHAPFISHPDEFTQLIMEFTAAT